LDSNIVSELTHTITTLDLDENLSLYDFLQELDLPDRKRPATPIMQGQGQVEVSIEDSALPRTLDELVDLLDLPQTTPATPASPHFTTFDPWDKWPI
jgi:hypothetical protein